ncbi:GntR family transcriptional regulator [Myxococcota bacterium]|nr:GntR family transcriptional regulator [Myxococcota bacterium]MBU1536191.1 GntR family transcriptional regulator [Myxococcota bacterium]
MDTTPNISPHAPKPVFLQIEHYLEEKIRTGELKTHSRLPSERQLASELNVSRGTVKKAYDNLVTRGLLQVRQGSGYYVMPLPLPMATTRMERAVDIIRQAIYELEKMRFTHRDVGDIFTSQLEERMESLRHFSVLTVDCNPEALEVYHRQLGTLSYANHREMLLADLEHQSSPAEVMAAYDIIITTTTHYNLLRDMAPELSDRLMSVGVSPSPETLVAIGRIQPTDRIGIVYRSRRYEAIVSRWITQFHPLAEIKGLGPQAQEETEEFLSTCDVLIVPASANLGFARAHLESMGLFRQRGGKVIKFEYRIEPGSLSHLDNMLLALGAEHGEFKENQ